MAIVLIIYLNDKKVEIKIYQAIDNACVFLTIAKDKLLVFFGSCTYLKNIL